MKHGNIIGGAAAKRLVEFKGAAIKDELLQLLFDARDDYNFCCNGIAPVLAPFATVDDIKKVTDLADLIQSEVTPDSSDNVAHGFTYGAAKFLAGLDISAIEKGFLSPNKSIQISEVRARILCNFLWDGHNFACFGFGGITIASRCQESCYCHLLYRNSLRA